MDCFYERLNTIGRAGGQERGKNMGLDIYCRWEDMTEDEKSAQITGYQNAGAAGYLRQSWPSLTAWDAVFEAVFHKDWMSFLYPQWQGFNDEEFSIADDNRKKIEESRDILQGYVDNPTEIPDSLSKYFDEPFTQEHAKEVIKSECQHMVDFINLALSKPKAKILFH